MTTIDNTTLDKLLEGVNPSDPQSMFSDAGLFGQLKKALAERMLQAELNHHLEQQRGVATPSRNHKNGSSRKTLLTTETRLALDIPRDRDGSFEPQLIATHHPGVKVRLGRFAFCFIVPAHPGMSGCAGSRCAAPFPITHYASHSLAGRMCAGRRTPFLRHTACRVKPLLNPLQWLPENDEWKKQPWYARSLV